MENTTQMTARELTAAARNYDNGVNEGGEGYNPYRSELDRREMAEEAARPLTTQDKIDALQRRIRVECGSVAREWGNNEDIDAEAQSLRAEIRRLESDIEAEFLAEWTLDVTNVRRGAWNEMVKAGKFGQLGGGKVDYRAMMRQQGVQGWMLDHLKRAIALHEI